MGGEQLAPQLRAGGWIMWRKQATEMENVHSSTKLKIWINLMPSLPVILCRRVVPPPPHVFGGSLLALIHEFTL